MGLQVANPFWLFALVPVAVALIVFAREKTSLAGARKSAWLTVRGLVCLLVILALAGLEWLWPVQHISTVFVADRSHSMADQEEAVKEAVNEAMAEKSPEDEAGVVTVGAEAAVEKPLTSDARDLRDFDTEVNRDYTNLASGLRLASTLFGDHARGRVVLMTDGNENIGDVKRQARYLHERGYTVDVMPFDVKRGKDVAVDAFDVPRTVFLGEQASLTVRLTSTEDTKSRLRISEDGQVILDETVQLKQGENRFSFQHLVETSGFHTYRVDVLTEGDEVAQNNTLSAFSDVRGAPRVLVVEGQQGEARNLTKALESSAAHVDVMRPALLPTELNGYLQYDSIVFSNVAAPSISERQMQLMARAVEDFAVGFIMTGGKQSFGLGGYFKTPIERILPVDMELTGEKEIPSLGLMIILDKSGSMAGNKMALAREAAARSVEFLRPKDTLGVIAFDGKPWQIVETGPIEDPKQAADEIRSISASGGTDIFTSLEMAYEQLQSKDLKRKHIILLTDGQSATSMNWRKMIQQGKDEHNMTLSTVSIGADADDGLLNEMADIGGGRFYDVHDITSIPTIFSRETALLTRTYIVDDPFHPKRVGGNEWGSHFADGVPEMNAYIATTPKGRAEQILTTHKQDLLLARWPYGLGKTVAWTSDLTGEWAGKWPAWNEWAPLWNDIVTWTFPQYEQNVFDVMKTIDGNKVTLKVTSADKRTDPTLDARLVNEDGEPLDFSLRAQSPGTYEGTFTAEQSGVYYLQLAGANSRFQTGIVVPYSQEYAHLAKNEDLLKEVAQIGGGRVLENPADAYDRDLPIASKPQELFYPLLVAALILFLLDVAVRRFHMSFAFLDRAFGALRTMRTKETKTIENHSNRLQQLKQASVKRTTQEQSKASDRKQSDTKGRSTHVKPQRHKSRAKNRQTEPSKPQQAAEPRKRQESEQKERSDRMARLLDAKNRRNKS